VNKEEGRLIRTQEMRKHKDEERMMGERRMCTGIGKRREGEN
jgi:hypothetical protein